MKRLAILLLPLVLAGCATTGGVIVPDEVLQCAPAPRSPADDPNATQADAGDWAIEVALAGADCRSKLGRVRELLTEATK